MRISALLIMILAMFPISFAGASPEKINKSEDTNPTVVVIKDGIKKTIPFSRTEKMNPDSVESVSVKNDTIFIQIKTTKSAPLKKNKSKK